MKSKIKEHLTINLGIDDDEMLDEIYNEYKNSLQSLLKQMEDNLIIDNYTELKRYAHSIKGCASNVGDDELTEIALQMECLVHAENSDELAKYLAECWAKFKSYP